MNGFVYKITSPTSRIYIGSSINPKKRFSDYRCCDCKYQRKLYNSFKKYTVREHIFEIIWEGPVEEMLNKEIYFGQHFNVLSQDNLNCKLPKNGDIFKCISEETRQKMSIVHKERFKNMTNEKRKNLGWQRKGKKLSQDQILKRAIAVQKPILQLDLQNNFIKEWDSATIASKTLKISQSDISQCCKNKKKTCGNFKWKYVNEELELLNYKPRINRRDLPNKNRKAVIQMDLNENFIKVWESISIASKELVIGDTHISRCCKQKRKSAYGFKWKYK